MVIDVRLIDYTRRSYRTLSSIQFYHLPTKCPYGTFKVLCLFVEQNYRTMNGASQQTMIVAIQLVK